ncbi:MAG: barstar family protein [Elusimicrobiota bacterium]
MTTPRKPHRYWISEGEVRSVVDIAKGIPKISIWTLDSRRMTSERDVWDLWIEVFGFARLFAPDRVGRNWDAMIDCFREVHSHPCAGWVIILRNADLLWEDFPTLYYKTMDVWDSVATEWAHSADRPIPMKIVLVSEHAELRRVIGHHLE